jgi:Fic-DOC domain mobile mystery protein B
MKMVFEFETPEGSTPLEPEELEQLIPAHITTMAQLNEAEQLNITAASLWALGRRRSDVLSEKFTKALHKRMFQDVWRWAGKYRTHGVNIGNVDVYEIGIRLHQLFDDVQHWIDNDVYTPDEIAARLHHGLTVIHPFPNGNGRHARLMVDVLLSNMGRPTFTWGSGGYLIHQGGARDQYLAALRIADEYNIQPLMDFARS